MIFKQKNCKYFFLLKKQKIKLARIWYKQFYLLSADTLLLHLNPIFLYKFFRSKYAHKRVLKKIKI